MQYEHESGNYIASVCTMLMPLTKVKTFAKMKGTLSRKNTNIYIKCLLRGKPLKISSFCI